MSYKTTKILKTIEKLQITGNRLLDVGCADGTQTIHLKRAMRSTDVYGIEISRQRARIAGANDVKVIQTDIEATPLPFSDSTLDVVVCSEIIEHLYNPSHLLSEIFRCLKPGGTCITLIPNLASWHSRLLLLLGYQPYSTSVSPEFHDLGVLIKGSWEAGDHQHEGGKDHIRIVTLRAFRELAVLHGFRVRHVTGIPTSANLLNPLLRRLFHLVESLSCRFPGWASFFLAVLVKPGHEGL